MRRLTAILSAIAVLGCRSTSEPCVPVPSLGCTWRAEYSDGKTVQIIAEIWYRTCPVEKPTPPYRVIPDTAAVCSKTP